MLPMFRALILSALVACSLTLTSSLAKADIPACTPDPDDEDIWGLIKNSNDPLDYLRYLQQFPQGCHRSAAKFRINALVPATVDLRVGVLTSDNRRIEVNGATWISAGLSGAGPNWVNQFYVQQRNVDPTKLKIQVRCQAEGAGFSEWIEGPCHPRGPTFMQGFSVGLLGSLREFYNLEVACLTKVGKGADRTERVASEGWCGTLPGEARRYVNGMSVSITRKTFD